MSALAQAPWLSVVWQRLQQALQQQRLAHGLLFCGSPGLGQTELAERLAARLLCSAPQAGDACGQCRSCRLRAAGTHPDLRRVGLLERDDGRLKTEIGVDQMRELGPWFALTTQLGGAQVVLIDPCDRLNTAAANALLKTLEEPSPGRYLLLRADRPERLPATVRSRCQRIEIRLPDHAGALAWLSDQGVAGERASAALEAADGHPPLALQLAGEGGLKRRAEVRADLQALLQGRQSAQAVAQRWLAGSPAECLQDAVASLRDAARQRLAAGLTLPADFHKLTRWADEANRTRDWLAAPLRHEMLLTALLQRWKSLAAARQLW